MKRLLFRKRPAVFLDRDGTIIEDVGALGDPADIRVFPDTGRALGKLSKKYDLFVVSNQGAVSNGILTITQVNEVNRTLTEKLAAQGITIKEWYVCPHDRKDGCQCIKPSSYFLQKAAKAYAIDLKRSFFIGDHPHDAYTGKEAGVFGMYLFSGHGARHLQELDPAVPVFPGILQAADWILKHPHPARDLAKAVRAGARALKKGGLTAFPTETVYGLGADALDSKAAEKIFKAKERPFNDPLISHVASKKDVTRLVKKLSSEAEALIDRFWPGPLTLVMEKSSIVPDVITAGTKTVAVRMPSHPVALDLIRRAGCPVAAPSANLFGRTSPTCAEHVRAQLEGKYDVLIDGGYCRVGVESTVLSLVGKLPRILRPGGISQEEIEAVIGPCLSNTGDGSPIETSDGNKDHQSPGMLPSHYAPKTPFFLVAKLPVEDAGTKCAGIILGPKECPPESPFTGELRVLSPSSDLKEAAANLYRVIQELDKQGLEKIYAVRMPHEGIGIAMNDRLTRAAEKSVE
ncbi:MAG: threonylcarbamoyl-AMP synthase [Spirochaetales bacterium]|nr:threonylcarbamoyl-AMP synthase [Spirochaetales bacterium]